MKTMNKKAITKIQAVLVAVVLIIAVAGGAIYYYLTTTPSEKVKLTFWHAYTREDAVTAIDLVMDKFMEEYPNVEVETVVTPHVAYAEYQAAAAAGEMPDLFENNEAMMVDLGLGGVLEPVTDIIEKYSDDYYQADLDQVYAEGEYWAVPWWHVQHVIYYRADWFTDTEEQAAFEAQYGYDLPSPPQTWEEFADVSEFFTRDLDDDGLDDQWGFAVALKGTDAYYLLGDFCATNQPIAVWDADGEYVFDSENTREVLEYIKELGDRDAIYKGGSQYRILDLRQPFLNGLSAMIDDSSSLIGNIAALSSENQSHFAVAPFPEKTSTGGLTIAMCLGVSKGPNSDWAKKLLDFWFSEEIIMEYSKANVLGFVPTQKSVAESDEYYDSARIAPYKDIIRGFAETHASGAYRLGQEYGPNPWNAAVRGEELYTNLLFRILNDGWSVDAALEEFGDAVAEVMEE